MRKNIVIILLTSLILILLSSCSSGTSSDEVQVNLRDRQFNIPIKFLRQAQAPAWLYNLGLDDDKNAILLTIKADDVVRHVDEYVSKNGKYPESILIYFAMLSEKEVKGEKGVRALLIKSVF